MTTLFGEPLPNARLSVGLADHAAPKEVFTSKDGSFRFVDLPTGRLEVQVAKPGFERLKVEVTLHSGEIERFDAGLQLTTLADGPRCRVRGKVQDAKGRPVTGGSVAGVAAFNAQIGGIAGIDGVGRYELELPVPAHYVVWVRGIDGVSQPKELNCPPDRNTDETMDFRVPGNPAFR